MFIGAVGGGGGGVVDINGQDKTIYIWGLIPPGTSMVGNEKATISRG